MMKPLISVVIRTLNESTYLENIALKLCDIYGLSLEEIANITTENSKQIFGF